MKKRPDPACFCRLDAKAECGECGRKQIVFDRGIVKALKKLKELDEFAGCQPHEKKCDICAVLKYAKRAGAIE